MTDPSFGVEGQPSTFRKDWAPRLGAVLLLLAGGLAVAKALGDGPANLQRGHQTSTSYAAVLAYEYAAVPITGAIVVAWALLVSVGLRRLRRRLAPRTALVAVGVASVALVWAGLSAFPQLFVGYEHLTSVTTAGEKYHLGIRTALDGDFYFVVTRCPHQQHRCTAYGVAPVDIDDRDDVSRVRLTVEDTGQGVVIQTANRDIPFKFP
jgi:hypothetical protein